MTTVRSEDHPGGVRVLTLDRPPANALDETLLGDLSLALGRRAIRRRRARRGAHRARRVLLRRLRPRRPRRAMRRRRRAAHALPRHPRRAARLPEADRGPPGRACRRRRPRAGTGMRLSARARGGLSARAQRGGHRRVVSACGDRDRAPPPARMPVLPSSRSGRRSIPPARRRGSASSTSSCPPSDSTTPYCAARRAWARSRAKRTRIPRRRSSPTPSRASARRQRRMRPPRRPCGRPAESRDRARRAAAEAPDALTAQSLAARVASAPPTRFGTPWASFSTDETCESPGAEPGHASVCVAFVGMPPPCL